MKYTYEEFPIKGKEELRNTILELFGRDIATVSCSFSTRNYAFIFAEGSYPAVIRVGIQAPHRVAIDVLSEIMWIDDLRNDVETVCQPVPSLQNRMVEQVTIDDQTYLITMFRKANGASLPTNQWNATYFYRVGTLLGKIHRTSSQGNERGFKYQRKSWDEMPYCECDIYEKLISVEARQAAEALIDRIKAIPKDPRWYGMIHGDFAGANLFYDWDTVWVFDFDDCCYGYFMFDIACVLYSAALSEKYPKSNPDKTLEELFYGADGAYTQLRKGYTEQYQLPEEHWDLLDQFFRLRVVQCSSIFSQTNLSSLVFVQTLIKATLRYLDPGDRPILRSEEIRKAMMENANEQEINGLKRI